jgi:hypothetical protein
MVGPCHCEPLASSRKSDIQVGGGRYLPEKSVFLHVLPYYTTPWEVSIIRRHALLRHVGYMSEKEDSPFLASQGDWQKVSHVGFRESYKDVYPSVMDALIL